MKRDFAKALLQTKGVVCPAGRLCGISPRSHYRWLKNDPNYAEITENGRRERLDMALALVLEKVAKGEQDSLKAAMFILENEGQAIGYGLKPGTAIQVNTAVNNQPGLVDVTVLRAYLKSEAEGKEARFSQTQVKQTNEMPPDKHGFSGTKNKGER